MIEKIHLIPGPVKTSNKVKLAAMVDVAPWGSEFTQIYSSVKSRITKLANGSDDHTTVIIPGCGHFVMEAILRSFVSGKILIPDTGNYSKRLTKLATECGLIVMSMSVPPTKKVDHIELEKILIENPDIKHVGLIYSETGTGVVHDIDAIGTVVNNNKRRMIVDAVSAFGALPINLENHPEIDAFGATANKCLEGLPGLGIITVRLERYYKNMKTLYTGICHMGLIPVIGHEAQGPIIINVHGPNHSSKWDAHKFSTDLYERGLIISPWPPLDTPSFRIGCIGAVTDDDINNALKIIRETMPSHF